MSAYAALESKLSTAYAELGWRVSDAKDSLTGPGASRLPIVYSSNYNISLGGLENLHSFDAKKFGKIVALLKNRELIDLSQLWSPVEATEQQLCDVHSQVYIKSLHASSKMVAEVVELPPARWLPNWLLQSRIVRPWRFHAGGTMLAAALSLQYGWSINIGGGMHHASRDSGIGWCAYDDLYLALRKLRRATEGAFDKCLLIDLDVHQGNGHERDKLHFRDDDLYIVDIYGKDLWPGDTSAKAAINVDVGIPCGTGDRSYLAALKGALKRATEAFKPDIIFYNAGSDILVGDPLGHMAVSAAAMQERDALVWSLAQQLRVPICMVLSGGYAKENAQTVGDSLANLLEKFEVVDNKRAPHRLW